MLNNLNSLQSVTQILCDLAIKSDTGQDLQIHEGLTFQSWNNLINLSRSKFINNKTAYKELKPHLGTLVSNMISTNF